MQTEQELQEQLLTQPEETGETNSSIPDVAPIEEVEYGDR